MNNERMEKKRQEVRENIKKVEMTYHQLLGQMSVLDELLEVKSNEE